MFSLPRPPITTNMAGLLRRAAEEPFDLGPRRLYADCLEEEGGELEDWFNRMPQKNHLSEYSKGAHVELIRRQCQLHPTPEDNAEAEKLAKQLYPAMDKLVNRVTQPAHLLQEPQFGFFVPELRVNTVMYEGMIPDINRFSSTLDPHFPQFALNLSMDTAVGPRENHSANRLAALNRCENLHRLTSLKLRHNNLGDGNIQALTQSTNLTGLTSLDISYNNLNPESIRALADCGWISNLSTLDLSVNNLGPAGIRALADCKNLSGLTSLSLRQNDLGSEGIRALADCKNLSNLTSLSLDINSMGVEGIRALAGCGWMSNLSTLDLSVNELGASGIRELADCKNLSGLTSLNLSYNDLGAEGIRALAGCKNLSGLTSLNLANNSLSSDSMRALASCENLSNLRSLDLSFNNIGVYSIRALVDCQNLSNLTSLELLNNVQMDARAIRALTSAIAEGKLPALREVHTSRSEWDQQIRQAIAERDASRAPATDSAWLSRTQGAKTTDLPSH